MPLADQVATIADSEIAFDSIGRSSVDPASFEWSRPRAGFTGQVIRPGYPRVGLSPTAVVCKAERVQTSSSWVYATACSLLRIGRFDKYTFW